MRHFRKTLTVLMLFLLLVAGLIAGGLAISLFIAFGSDKALWVEGPVINTKELQSCQVVLIDLERIDVSTPDLLTLLPNPLERINVTLLPESQFNAGLLNRESVDSQILGSDTCIAALEPGADTALETGTWTVTHSAIGLPWLEFGDMVKFIVNSTGTSISFNVAQASNSTLVIAVVDEETPIQQIALNAELSYSNAHMWIIASATVSGALLILFVVIVVMLMVKSSNRQNT